MESFRVISGAYATDLQITAMQLPAALMTSKSTSMSCYQDLGRQALARSQVSRTGRIYTSSEATGSLYQTRQYR